MSVCITDKGEFYEVSHLKDQEGLQTVIDRLPDLQDKPIYFTVDFDNDQAIPFYTLLIERGSIEMTHVVFRKVNR